MERIDRPLKAGSMYSLNMFGARSCNFNSGCIVFSLLIRQPSSTNLKIRAEIQAGHKMLGALILECVKILTLI